MAKKDSETPDIRLTPAQERELLAAMRVHPAAYQPKPVAVPKRLCELGILRQLGHHGGFVMTRVGLDHVARVSAQRIIDAVNAAPTKVEQPPVRADGAPQNWPFPVSCFPWSADPP